MYSLKRGLQRDCQLSPGQVWEMIRRGKRTTASQLHLYHLQERDARIPMGQVDAVGSEKKLKSL